MAASVPRFAYFGVIIISFFESKHSASRSYSEFNCDYVYETEKKNKSKASPIVDFFDWVDVLAVALVTVVLIFTFVCRVATIEGQSMENTFFDSEKVVVSNVGYTPKRSDVVIISRNYNNDTNLDMNLSNNQPIIKRVIATENQTVLIRDGSVFVDGNRLTEEYAKGLTYPNNMEENEAVTVPKGCVFVLGDNRENSRDSRSFDIGNRGNGMIDTEFIIGKVRLRIFPINKFGGIK